jgi:hypothetical protein
VAAPDIVGKIAVILMEGKDDKGYDVRLAIVQVLHRLVRRSPGQIPRVFTACVGFLSDARAEVREAAAQALQNLIKTNPAYAATQLQTTIEAAGKAIALAPTIFSPLNPYHSHILEIQALHHRAHIAAIQVLRDIATVSLMSQNCYHEGHENA